MNKMIPSIPMSTVKLLDNVNKFQVVYPPTVKKLTFMGWYSRNWFVLDEEGMTDALFDKQLLVDFLKDMIQCPSACRSYKVLSKDEFKACPRLGTVYLAKDDQIFKSNVCIKIKKVGYLFFEASYLYLYDENEELLHVAYVD